MQPGGHEAAGGLAGFEYQVCPLYINSDLIYLTVE